MKLAAVYLAPTPSSLESVLTEVPQRWDYHLDRGVGITILIEGYLKKVHND
jgi:hypothetical protein